jgi:hypothetical protein
LHQKPRPFDMQLGLAQMTAGMSITYRTIAVVRTPVPGRFPKYSARPTIGRLVGPGDHASIPFHRDDKCAQKVKTRGNVNHTCFY